MIKMKKAQIFFLLYSFLLFSCSKNNSNSTTTPIIPAAPSFSFNSLKVNGVFTGYTYNGINTSPILKFNFTAPVNRNAIAGSVTIKDQSSNLIAYNISYESNDSTIILQPTSALQFLTKYTVSVSTSLLSSTGGHLLSEVDVNLMTSLDSTDKFAQISDSALLDLVQKQTFKYFWDFGQPDCGMALERNTSGNTVTTGGTGFGIMAMIVAANRSFITRSAAVARINKILNFLTTKCQRWHGAFSHWIDGPSGTTVAFSTNNGADIVETSYLMEGLLTARQYFNSTTDVNEIALRDSVNSIWKTVEWNWFTQNGAVNGLYWQYNPTYSTASSIWSIPVTGWNEALITYVLAASSPNFAISKSNYDNGWASNGSIKNGNNYFGIQLPLGPSLGGPLFFEQYSFIGINPNNLSDAYCANYMNQAIAHSLINYNYCVANPQNYFGYSSSCWGLTASDISNGYNASSPTNDVGVIAPTAALSSMPFSPVQSMNVLRFFYYKLGDKMWGAYGFYDAFNLSGPWFATSNLAIDQGPIIDMIENYRSGLLWNLFMSCPEVKTGMKSIGFTSPNL